jgi:hypothetical protein
MIDCQATISLNSNDVGPRSIRRCEGERDVFIPCPFDVGFMPPYWRINDAFYYITQLPFPFIPSISPSGLIIRYIHRDLNGTSLQCFTTQYERGDLKVSNSSKGILAVLFNEDEGNLKLNASCMK